MNITPMDITHKKFSSALRGYNQSEVNEFLADVGLELERASQERAQLIKELDSHKKALERYHTIEETLQNTMMLAQKTSEEAVSVAKREADLIIEGARRKGDDIQREFAQVKAEKETFLVDFIALLEAQLERARHAGGG